MPHALSLPEPLARKFAELEARLRRLALLRGFGFVLLVLCAGVVLALALDWYRDVSLTARLGVLAAVGGSVLVAAYVGLIRPWLRRYSPLELAAVVEHTHPELKESLLSTIELNDPNVPDAEKGSAYMREQLARRTMKSVAPIDFRESVSGQRSARMALWGAMAVLLLLVPFLFSPAYAHLWSRFLNPWGNYDSPSNLVFEIEGGDRTVARGDDVTIVAKPGWRSGKDDLPQEVRLNWIDADGRADSRIMDFDEPTGTYRATRPQVVSPFTFNVAADRARTRDYSIDVVERPEIVAFTLDVAPPAYTGLPAEKHDGVVGEISVFEHSRLAFRLEFNKPVARADIQWLDRKAPQPPQDAEPGENAAHTALTLSEDRRSATWETTATEGGPFAVRVLDEHELANAAEPHRRLVIVPDAPPELTVADLPATARATDLLRVSVEASDDIGLGALELHYEVVDGPEHHVPLPVEQLGAEVAHLFEIDLGPLNLRENQAVSVRVRAADERPVPKPNEVWSEAMVVTIASDAQPAQSEQVAMRQQEIRDLLEGIREDVAEARKQAAELHDAADETPEDAEFERAAEVPPLADAARELAERVEELALRFGQHPLHANLKPPAQEVARQPLTQAADQLDDAASAEAAERAEALEESAQQLADAEDALDEIAGQFEELARLEQDLLQLDRLARDAEKLADDALALRERQEHPPADETPVEQAAREEELERQQEALRQRQQQLASQLDELLNRNPDLLTAARKRQMDRLAELARELGEMAEPQDLLADALQREAEQTAAEAQPLVERQQELADRAQQLAEQLAQQPDLDQVTPLDPEAVREAIEELQRGNLQAAAEKQDAAAEALERLAEELEKNLSLPADPQQAAQALAERQRDLAQRIADARQNTPAADAPQQERDAFSAEMRNLAAEQAAVQDAAARLAAPPAADQQQREAVDRAEEAVEQLLDEQPQQAAQSADEAAEALETLAKQIGSPEERLARARDEVEQLRKRQQELAEQVETAAQSENAEDELQRLVKEQRDVAEDLSQLDAPGAEEEQRLAVEEAASALNDLQQGRSADAPASQSRAQQALADLQRQLAGQPTTRESLDALAQRQSDIAQQSEAAARAGDQAALDEQEARQQDVADQLAALDAPAAASEQAAAQQAAQEAKETLRDGDAQEIADATRQAEEAIDEMRQALPSPRDAAADQQDQQRQQAAQEAAQLAQEQRQLRDELARQQRADGGEQMAEAPGAPQENPAGNTQPEDGNPSAPESAAQPRETGAEGTPQQARAPGDQQPSDMPGQPSEGSQPGSQAQQAQAGQQQVSRDAAQLALDAAEQLGPESDAAQQAAEFARQAAQAGQQAQQGRLDRAAETAQQAADTAQQSAESMQSAPGASPELGQRAADLAQRQSEQAEALADAAQSDDARRQAQAAGQGRFAENARELANQLADAAERLGSAPLNQPEAGRDAADAAQALREAIEAMQQARENLGRNDRADASAAARQAAEALRQASGQLGQIPGDQPSPSAPLPSALAEMLADAMRHLENAQQSSGQPSGQNPNGQSPSGQSPDGQQSSSQNPSGQPRPGEGNSPSPGGSSPEDSLAQAAQQLQQAADALAQGTGQPGGRQGGQPGGRQPGQPGANSGQSGSQPGTPGANPTGLGDGHPAGSQEGEVDLAQLDAELQRMTNRQWGQLPSHLRTEILQGARKRPSSDYAKVIKLYFEEIARQGAKTE